MIGWMTAQLEGQSFFSVNHAAWINEYLSKRPIGER